MNENDDDLGDLGPNDPGGVDSQYSAKGPRGAPSFLPDSATGSPRHLKCLAENALTLVSEFGPASLFITLTCNTNWPEFKERLPAGQTAYTRPDITCEVFHQRLEAMKHNLRQGKYFDGQTAYIIVVIEYQERGLPHAHIVIRLCNTPSHEDLPACTGFIDKYISAELPPEYTAADLIGLTDVTEIKEMEDNIR